MTGEGTATAEAPAAGPAAPRRGWCALRVVLGALSGLLAGGAALAVAELVAAAVRPESGPVTAVGGAVVDRAPAGLKDFAVRTFGEQDKLVLQLGILAVLVLFALALGLLALRHRLAGSAGVLVFGAVGALAAVARPEGNALDALPSVVGALVGAGALRLLAGRLTGRGLPAPVRGAVRGPVRGAAAAEDTGGSGGAGGTGGAGGSAGPHDEGAEGARSPLPGSFDRRGFALAAGAVTVGSAGAGLLGRRLGDAGGADAAASRDAVRLPAPASRAAPVPGDADLGVEGVGPFITRNSDFYRVDTALVVPRVDAAAWRLRLHGKGVTRPLTLDFAELLNRRLIERDITLTCVSNQVGGPYVGNARWLGVPLADLLREAGVRPPSRGGRADQLVARSEDGMTLGSPVETVMDGRDAMLAVGMNGEALPFTHGFPVRMVVPGLYGYVSACKWLKDLELASFDDYDVYWVRHGWAKKAPVKTQSRIDTPKPLASVRPGTVTVAGVAWAQHTGIARVEVRVDHGPWHPARLSEEDSRDTWRQWVWQWPATSGSHTLQVRATDRSGETQTAERVGTVPDGATGRHSVVVTVT